MNSPLDLAGVEVAFLLKIRLRKLNGDFHH